MSIKQFEEIVERESHAPEAPAPEVRERLLTALRGRERWTPFAPELARLFAVAAEDAREALQRIDDQAAWQPGIWPGSQLLRTPALTAVSALIARLPAGMRIRPHSHATRELTYILDGELVEAGSSQVWSSGELLDKARGSAHELEVVGDAQCLVVFALVAD